MSFNMKDMTQGGQLFTMRLRMFGQIIGQIVWVLTILFLSVVGISLYFDVSKQNFLNGIKYWWCWSTKSIPSLGARQSIYNIEYYGHTLKYTTQQVLTDAYTTYCGELIYKEFISACLTGGIFVGGLFVLTVFLLAREGKQQSEDEITGGRTLTDDPKAVTKLLKRKGVASDIVFEKLALVKDSEVQNFSIHGTVGSGKSRAYRTLMTYARQRGDLAIVYDKAGTYVEEFYNPTTDHILNPMDERCANWDMWSELVSIPDYENYASLLIPMGTSDDPFWQGSARTIFAEGAYRMRKEKNRSYWRLMDTLLSITLDKLRSFLANTPAANLVAAEIEKTAISIRGILTNYVKALRYLIGIEKAGPKFTIREWMADVKDDGEKNGWLFISSDERNHESLRPVLSAWIGMSVKNLMSLRANRERRVWFFFDELPTLQNMSSLVGNIAEARKFGGCFVLGIQSYAQLEEIYGVKNAAAMFDTLNTRFFFRNPSALISKWVAEELGEKERKKANEQFSYGADSVRDGVSVCKDEDRTQLVSYSDVQTLDNLQCYVTLPGPYPVIKITMKYQPFPQIAEGFILRDMRYDELDNVNKRIEELEAQTQAMNVLFAPADPNQIETTPAQPPKPTVQSEKQATAAAKPTNKKNSSNDDASNQTESGGGRQEGMENELPPGVTADGEIIDYQAYEDFANQQEQVNEQRDMARKEEVNINHSVTKDVTDGFEPGGHF